MNGHGNARSLARALSPICLGVAANGVQLLSPGTVDLNFQEQSNDIDLVLVTPLRLGVGLGLPEPRSFAFMPHEKICFWGGSMVVMNPRPGATLAYAMIG
jgi:hypothetical protein